MSELNPIVWDKQGFATVDGIGVEFVTHDSGLFSVRRAMPPPPAKSPAPPPAKSPAPPPRSGRSCR